MARKKLRGPFEVFWAGYKLRMLEERITTAEAADILGKNIRRVQQYITAGRIPAERIGKNNFIVLRDVLEFMDTADLRPGKRAKWAEKNN